MATASTKPPRLRISISIGAKRKAMTGVRRITPLWPSAVSPIMAAILSLRSFSGIPIPHSVDRHLMITAHFVVRRAPEITSKSAWICVGTPGILPRLPYILRVCLLAIRDVYKLKMAVAGKMDTVSSMSVCCITPYNADMMRFELC